MAHLYIAFVDTPGLFAGLIRRFLKQRYVHVVISTDKELENAYSVGRRNPAIPILAGFERENKEKILQQFPTAYYRICEIDCTLEQKSSIMKKLERDYRRRFQIHYAVIGLPFLVIGVPFYIRDQYTCSSYLAKLLQENDIWISNKHFSMVTPKDFYEYRDMKLIFEGELSEIVKTVPYGRKKKYSYMFLQEN